jgi:hypothetical protein
LFKEKFALAGDVANSKLWSPYTVRVEVLGMTPEEAEHEEKLVLWNNNNILPSEGMIADSMADKDVKKIKDRIEQISASGSQDQGGGADMQGMSGMSGGDELGMGGAPPPPPTDNAEMKMPGATPEAPALNAGRIRAGGMLKEEINKRLSAVYYMSESRGRNELIHLFNEGELDYSFITKEDGQKEVINEDIIRDLLI